MRSKNLWRACTSSAKSSLDSTVPWGLSDGKRNSASMTVSHKGAILGGFDVGMLRKQVSNSLREDEREKRECVMSEGATTVVETVSSYSAKWSRSRRGAVDLSLRLSLASIVWHATSFRTEKPTEKHLYGVLSLIRSDPDFVARTTGYWRWISTSSAVYSPILQAYVTTPSITLPGFSKDAYKNDIYHIRLLHAHALELENRKSGYQA